MQIGQNAQVVNLQAPAAISSTTKGKIVDTAGCDGVLFTMGVGAATGSPGASHKIVNSLEESDGTADGGTWTAVAADRYLMGPDGATKQAPPALDGAGAFSKAYAFGIRPGKRYVRPVQTVTGTISAAISWQAIKSGLRHAPPTSPVEGITAT